jgi:hypothetical protein
MGNSVKHPLGTVGKHHEYNNPLKITDMIEFEVKSKKQTIGPKKGQTVWYAQPKSVQKLTNKMVVDRIVRETSLSASDVSNAMISLGAIVRDALLMGASVDLADLG